ncbi:hypothetical protein OFN55_38270, partial [Escherichia coli]|nr:hypothetical protein [Escherichia coli]
NTRTARLRAAKPVLLDVPAGFCGELCSGGARKIHYVKNDRIHENHQNCAGWFTYRLDMGSEGQ